MIFSTTNNFAMDSETSSIAKRYRIDSADRGGGGGDGSSIEIAKRPRGRPPGSKNKPKPPVIITREQDPSAAMRPHILEIPSGHDLIDSIVRFSRRKNLGVCVLSGNGTVANVTLRQPPHPTVAAAGAGAGAATTVGFHGRFEILSLSATVMPPAVSAVFAPGVALTMAGPQGQVIGGAVVGPLLTAGMVTVVAATFDNPTFHRLPAVEDDSAVAKSGSFSGGGGDESSGQQQNQQAEEEEEEAEEEQQHYGHREYQHHHHAAAGDVSSCGMAIYSSHFPPEIVWPPTARPPHPPPY